MQHFSEMEQEPSSINSHFVTTTPNSKMDVFWGGLFFFIEFASWIDIFCSQSELLGNWLRKSGNTNKKTWVVLESFRHERWISSFLVSGHINVKNVKVTCQWHYWYIKSLNFNNFFLVLSSKESRTWWPQRFAKTQLIYILLINHFYFHKTLTHSIKGYMPS